ncbi:hypothetical protein WME79_01480 [Sorangium sp. So ce726]|uniref:hypothetical protein n=1 Tax=Sorangium sp. So ce726 TaxID=3133319 RepID=UPI003F5EBDDD
MHCLSGRIGLTCSGPSADAVGNQIAQIACPGGMTVRYTPFDLPEQITQGASCITFDYDGDQQRIRKTTREKETIYFGDLYERVTEVASSTHEIPEARIGLAIGPIVGESPSRSAG